MKNNKINMICLCALFMALAFVITRFLQIPIPLGYFNIGNSVVLLGCLFMPAPYGVIAGAIGSALADLTSFPVYTLPTLVIKALMPMLFYWLQRIPVKKVYWKNVLIFSIVTLIPLFGYTATGCVLYGGFVAGLAQFPGLLLEYIANIIVFSVLYSALARFIHK